MLNSQGPHGLTAWIEVKDEIAILFVANHGIVIRQRSLARTDTADFGYEGCSAHRLIWYGDHVVVFTSERGHFYVQVLEPLSNTLESMSFSYAWHWDRDLIFAIGPEPCLLSSSALPSLEPRPPLVFRGVYKMALKRLDGLEGFLRVSGSSIDTLALPTDRQRSEYQPVPELFDIVEQRVCPGREGRFLIEALALPFQAKRQQRSAVWMPFHWHQHLQSSGRRDEAARLLDLLDEIALPLPEAQPEWGWDPGWTSRQGQIELAARAVCRRCRVLAAACRSGELPAI